MGKQTRWSAVVCTKPFQLHPLCGSLKPPTNAYILSSKNTKELYLPLVAMTITTSNRFRLECHTAITAQNIIMHTVQPRFGRLRNSSQWSRYCCWLSSRFTPL